MGEFLWGVVFAWAAVMAGASVIGLTWVMVDLVYVLWVTRRRDG